MYLRWLRRFCCSRWTLAYSRNPVTGEEEGSVDALLAAFDEGASFRVDIDYIGHRLLADADRVWVRTQELAGAASPPVFYALVNLAPEFENGLTFVLHEPLFQTTFVVSTEVRQTITAGPENYEILVWNEAEHRLDKKGPSHRTVKWFVKL